MKWYFLVWRRHKRHILLGGDGDPRVLWWQESPVLVPGDRRPGEHLVGHLQHQDLTFFSQQRFHLAAELQPPSRDNLFWVAGLQHRGSHCKGGISTKDWCWGWCVCVVMWTFARTNVFDNDNFSLPMVVPSPIAKITFLTTSPIWISFSLHVKSLASNSICSPQK